MSIQYEDAGLSGCYGDMGSFPKSFDYGPEEPDDEVDRPASTADKPRILLMGLRRSGKSSIQKVKTALGIVKKTYIQSENHFNIEQ